MRPPESWQAARATLVIAGLTAFAWLLATGTGNNQLIAFWGGFIPARLDGASQGVAHAPLALTPLTATFIHAGFIHLGFNLLILLFCGRAVENILGTPALILLYVIGAYAAAAAHYAFNIGELVPMIGASGAIFTVLGAYAMLFGRNRVRMTNPTLALLVNALWLAAAMVGLQLLIGMTFSTFAARIAIAAHIGGFLVGLIMARPLLLFRYRSA
jgi:membrane associated rhomboid family serine protease